MDGSCWSRYVIGYIVVIGSLWRFVALVLAPWTVLYGVMGINE